MKEDPKKAVAAEEERNLYRFIKFDDFDVGVVRALVDVRRRRRRRGMRIVAIFGPSIMDALYVDGSFITHKMFQ